MYLEFSTSSLLVQDGALVVSGVCSYSIVVFVEKNMNMFNIFASNVNWTQSDIYVIKYIIKLVIHRVSEASLWMAFLGTMLPGMVRFD